MDRKTEIAELEERLRQMESGELTIKEDYRGERMKDVTPARIAELKAKIAKLQASIGSQ